MTIGRFIVSVVAAYAVFAVFETAGYLFLYQAEADALMERLRADGGNREIYAHVGHLIQTAVIVWLFDKAVGSNDMKRGLVFGGMIGLYLIGAEAVNASWMGVSDSMLAKMSLTHLITAVVIGMVLAALHRAAGVSKTNDPGPG